MDQLNPQPAGDPTKVIEPEPPSLPYVVGIGASAGGLEALERFFGNLPDSPGWRSSSSSTSRPTSRV